MHSYQNIVESCSRWQLQKITSIYALVIMPWFLEVFHGVESLPCYGIAVHCPGNVAPDDDEEEDLSDMEEGDDADATSAKQLSKKQQVSQPSLP